SSTACASGRLCRRVRELGGDVLLRHSGLARQLRPAEEEGGRAVEAEGERELDVPHEAIARAACPHLRALRLARAGGVRDVGGDLTRGGAVHGARALTDRLLVLLVE